MKQIFYKVLFIFCFTSFFFSCSNEDDIVSGIGTEEVEVPLSPEVAKMQAMAKIVSGIVENPDVLNEVKTGVENSLYYGFDEELRFMDILQPQESKLLKSGQSSPLASSLRNALENYDSDNQLRSSSSGSSRDLEAFILNENVQIYWPYSKNWDGEELPVVTFSPETDGADKVVAYRQVEGANGKLTLESIIVDEKYAMEHPVWVINKNDVNYTDLPDFHDGEYIKNGVLFSSEFSQESKIELKSSTADPVYVFKLGVLQATEHHDDWLNGGSEFEFQCASPEAPGYISAGVTKIRRCISRGDINSNGTIFHVFEPLNTNWRPEQIQNGLKVMETDGGGTKTWDFAIGVYNYSINVKIPYGSNDDFIYEKVLDRAYILSSENLYSTTIFNIPVELPMWHTHRGLKWTMYIHEL